MKKAKAKKEKENLGMVAESIQQIADTLGVHRRTLQEYKSKGCPIIAAPGGGYYLAPTIHWYFATKRRRMLRKFLKSSESRMHPNIIEAMRHIIDEHEQISPGYLERKYGGEGGS